MKITFDENGYEYIEVKPSENGFYIAISAPGAENPRKTVVNSAELTREQLLKLISDIDNKEKEK